MTPGPPPLLFHMLLAVLLSSPAWIRESICMIKHCDPNTDKNRENYLTRHNLTRLREWLYSNETGGRVGTLHFITWRDPVLEIKGPKKCRWRMLVGNREEQRKFNDKVYEDKTLHAEPPDVRYYHRVIACEADDCIQFYNVIARPPTKPDFPVQVYTNHPINIRCSLNYMEDPAKNYYILNHQPPYEFEWTGPRDCPRSAWHSDDATQCRRYKCQNGTCDPVTKYNFTSIKVTSKRKKKGGSSVDTQFETVLKIKKATMEHRGTWRCIVYDKLGVSSHPDAAYADFIERQDIDLLGVVDVHVKDLKWAIGIPVVAVAILLVFVVLSILLCKQCTDYDLSPDDGKGDKEEPPEPDKTSSQQSVQTARSKLATESTASTVISRVTKS